MVDYFEALRVQATPNPLPPPVDPQQVEAVSRSTVCQRGSYRGTEFKNYYCSQNRRLPKVA